MVARPVCCSGLEERVRLTHRRGIPCSVFGGVPTDRLGPDITGFEAPDAPRMPQSYLEPL